MVGIVKLFYADLHKYCFFLSLSFFIFFFNQSASHAQEKKDELSELINGVENSFSLPFQEWLDSKKEKKSLEDLSYNAGFSLAKQNSGVGYFPVLNASVKFTPLGDWFAEALFFYYTEKEEQDSWEPDFVYRFGYEDWRPYALSLVYSNYTGNHSLNDIADQYNRGSYGLTWNLPIPDVIAQPFLIEIEKKISCNLGVIYSPRYIDAQDNYEQGQDKFRGRMTFNAPVYGDWFVSFNFLYYLDSSQQQPWDPDYTYEIGWHGEYFSISYKNYGGTRFPWRSDLPHDSDFIDGSIGISWSWN
jgi:hypothetical protein